MDYLDSQIACPYFKKQRKIGKNSIILICEGAGEKTNPSFVLTQKQLETRIREKCGGILSCRTCFVCRANDEYWRNAGEG